MLNDSDDVEYRGGCLCHAIRFSLRGKPLRVTICHCDDCRRTSGSMFSTSGAWLLSSFETTGLLSTYSGRTFCSTCGSRVATIYEDKQEVEIMLGSLDWGQDELLRPEFELNIRRRAHWLSALPGAEQHQDERVEPSDT